MIDTRILLICRRALSWEKGTCCCPPISHHQCMRHQGITEFLRSYQHISILYGRYTGDPKTGFCFWKKCHAVFTLFESALFVFFHYICPETDLTLTSWAWNNGLDMPLWYRPSEEFELTANSLGAHMKAHPAWVTVSSFWGHLSSSQWTNKISLLWDICEIIWWLTMQW